MLGYIFYNVTFYKSIGCWFWLWDVYSGLTKAVFMYPPHLRPSGQCFLFSFLFHFSFSHCFLQLWLVLILSSFIFFHLIYCCSNFCCFFYFLDGLKCFLIYLTLVCLYSNLIFLCLPYVFCDYFPFLIFSYIIYNTYYILHLICWLTS